MSNPDDQSAVPGPKIGDELSAEARLRLVLRAFAAAPLGADTPQLLISQAVAATGSSGGVVCGVRANRVVILASEGYTPDQGRVQPAYHGGSVLAPDPFGTRYPSLLEDTIAAGLASTASLALHGRGHRVISAMGVAWTQAQAFTDAQKDEVRLVARLAADALGRAQMLEAERAARERTERLQRTMTALVASASLAEVTAAVFQHGLPFGASAARLALVDRQQPELLVTLNEVGIPESVGAGWEALPVSAPSPSREAAATSTTVYLPNPEDLAAKYPDAYKVLVRPSYQAWVALPLRSGGHTLGILTLAFPEPHPIDDGPDQIILAALGSAVADALSRAIQHDIDRDLVMSVQRSLLPETLPEHPGVRLGARYMPAETRYGIGGDWYDAVLLPGGRILLLVGDVAGHGLKAAITMGQLRSAARALAPTHGPAALLDALDQFMGSGPDVLPATAAVAIIDPAERTLRYCLAGHPPLLLRDPDGTLAMLDEARGPLWAVRPGAVRSG